jgi:dynein heavy chain
MVSQYIQSVKQNIHCVIAMSPMGEVFQTRLRMFPSLINCCTIDWFTNWPAEALVNVAKGSIGDDPDCDLADDKESVIEMFKIIHQSVEAKVEDFWEMYRRRSYVTPTSYLELLATFKKTLNDKRAEVSKSKRRLERGLKVLAMASIQVAELQEKLKVSQPALIKKQGEIEI